MHEWRGVGEVTGEGTRMLINDHADTQTLERSYLLGTAKRLTISVSVPGW